MRSPITRQQAGWRGSPPWMERMELPAPSTCAPIPWRKRCKSTISGSRAAPMMVVRPGQPQAASMTFSVAPTLGKGRQIS